MVFRLQALLLVADVDISGEDNQISIGYGQIGWKCCEHGGGC
jgi:hypothetical protein